MSQSAVCRHCVIIKATVLEKKMAVSKAVSCLFSLVFFQQISMLDGKVNKCVSKSNTKPSYIYVHVNSKINHSGFCLSPPYYKGYIQTTMHACVYMCVWYIIRHIKQALSHHMSKHWPKGYGSNNNSIFILTIHPCLVYMLDHIFLFMPCRLKHVWYTTGIFIYVKQGRTSDWVGAEMKQWQQCIFGIWLLAPLRLDNLNSPQFGQWHFQHRLFLYPAFTNQTQINMQSDMWTTTARQA